MNRTALALKMLALLRVSGKLKKKEIAEKLEVKERYVVDLKNELITAGYNIVTESGVDGGYLLDDSMIISLPKLSDGEETALIELYREISSSNKPIGSLDALAALEKVCSDLHPDVSSPTLLIYSLIQREDTVDNEREYFTKLIYAIKNTRKIIARYDSFRGCSDRERIIQPYTISKINEYYYLVGYEENSRMFKLFKLIRFVSLVVTDKTFRKDIAYDAKAYIDNLGGKAIGEEVRLKLRIAGPYMKTLQETPYGKDVVINKHEDYLIYETTLRGNFIINEFILKMGRYCKVMEPKELVDQTAKTYELLSYSYSDDEADTESFPYFQVIREDLMSNEREEVYVCIANHSLDEVSQWIDENKRESARKGVDSFYGFTYVFENELEMNAFLDLVKGRFREFGLFDWNELTEKLSSIPGNMGYVRIIDRHQSHDYKIDSFCVISKKLFNEKYAFEKEQTKAWKGEDTFILLDSIEEGD